MRSDGPEPIIGTVASGTGLAARLRRHGSMSVELLLLLPILLMVLVAFVQFSLSIAATERLSHASQVGARMAAQGGSKIEVENAIRRALGQYPERDVEIEITKSCTHRGHGPYDGADDAGRAKKTDGDDSNTGRCCHDEVRVCIRVKAAHAIPGPTRWCWGKDEKLTGCSVMRME